MKILYEVRLTGPCHIPPKDELVKSFCEDIESAYSYCKERNRNSLPTYHYYVKEVKEN